METRKIIKQSMLSVGYTLLGLSFAFTIVWAWDAETPSLFIILAMYPGLLMVYALIFLLVGVIVVRVGKKWEKKPA